MAQSAAGLIDLYELDTRESKDRWWKQPEGRREVLLMVGNTPVSPGVERVRVLYNERHKYFQEHTFPGSKNQSPVPQIKYHTYLETVTRAVHQPESETEQLVRSMDGRFSQDEMMNIAGKELSHRYSAKIPFQHPPEEKRGNFKSVKGEDWDPHKMPESLIRLERNGFKEDVPDIDVIDPNLLQKLCNYVTLRYPASTNKSIAAVVKDSDKSADRMMRLLTLTDMFLVVDNDKYDAWLPILGTYQVREYKVVLMERVVASADPAWKATLFDFSKDAGTSADWVVAARAYLSGLEAKVSSIMNARVKLHTFIKAIPSAYRRVECKQTRVGSTWPMVVLLQKCLMENREYKFTGLDCARYKRIILFEVYWDTLLRLLPENAAQKARPGIGDGQSVMSGGRMASQVLETLLHCHQQQTWSLVEESKYNRDVVCILLQQNVPISWKQRAELERIQRAKDTAVQVSGAGPAATTPPLSRVVVTPRIVRLRPAQTTTTDGSAAGADGTLSDDGQPKQWKEHWSGIEQTYAQHRAEQAQVAASTSAIQGLSIDALVQEYNEQKSKGIISWDETEDMLAVEFEVPPPTPKRSTPSAAAVEPSKRKTGNPEPSEEPVAKSRKTSASGAEEEAESPAQKQPLDLSSSSTSPPATLTIRTDGRLMGGLLPLLPQDGGEDELSQGLGSEDSGDVMILSQASEESVEPEIVAIVIKCPQALAGEVPVPDSLLSIRPANAWWKLTPSESAAAEHPVSYVSEKPADPQVKTEGQEDSQ